MMDRQRTVRAMAHHINHKREKRVSLYKQKTEEMSLKCGIVGLPNVGKSTLFNCISSSKAQAANFPFCTIDPNLGSTNVPDERLTILENIVHPRRVIPATVDIVD